MQGIIGHSKIRWSIFFQWITRQKTTICHKQNRSSQLERVTSHGRIRNARAESDAVIPFTPASTNAISAKADQLDDAGQTLLQLVQKAAGVAEQNNKHALGIAQRLSQQLRAADD